MRRLLLGLVLCSGCSELPPSTSARSLEAPRLFECSALSRVAAEHGYRRPEREDDRLTFSRGGIDCDQDVLEIAVSSDKQDDVARAENATHERALEATIAGGTITFRVTTIDEAGPEEDALLSSLRDAVAACKLE
ncbi:MAG: hypothetical protein U0271_03790 [Polyangiaceae bacterium]